MNSKIKVRFNRDKKTLRVEVEDVAFMTPFQPSLMGEILTSIADVLEKQQNNYRFKYFKEDKDNFGWRSVKKD